MRYLLIILLLTPFLIFSQTESSKDAYLSYLKSEGYVAEVTNAGNIKFKFEGDSYFITINDDELFFVV